MSTSFPHVGFGGEVSVAIANGVQSDGYVGKLSCTEQNQPCRSLLWSVENWPAFEISDTLPPHGGLVFSLHVLAAMLSCGRSVSIRSGVPFPL